MDHNKFFTVEVDESSGQAFRVMPTDYLEELHPHQAISEMKEYVKDLGVALEEYSRNPQYTPFGVSGIGGLAFEFELVRTFLASFEQVYGTMH